MHTNSNVLSTAVPLEINNIATTQIIPSRFIKNVENTMQGLEKNLFRDWRFYKDGSINDDFILNKDAYFGKILITGRNFGCGSQYQKQAAQALLDYGFKFVISSHFSKKFKENSSKIGVLPIQISKDFLQTILNVSKNKPKSLFLINIDEQTVTLKETGQLERFEIFQSKLSA